MPYPGRAARKGDSRSETISLVQARLNEVGCGPLEVDGVFGDATESSVMLFQTRRNLQPDGVVGPLTWSDLFQEASPVVDTAPTQLLRMTMDVALAQRGVRETPGKPNRGPIVDDFIRAVGLNPEGGYSWCQAFVYWCFEKAAHDVPLPNPCVKTAGVLDHWRKSPMPSRIYASDAFNDPRLIRPGAIFIVDHGSGRGHTGLVTKISSGEIGTIEGNTNERGSREGDGVYQKTRSISSINVGFIDYGH